MKAFAEYIPSAMYFAEAFFEKKQLTNTPQGYIVQNIEIPMQGIWRKYRYPSIDVKKEKMKSGRRSGLWRKNRKTEI